MSEDSTTPTPKRRWLRFRLRTFFVVVTVVCCVLASLGSRMYQVRQQHNAVDAITALGGGVHWAGYKSGSADWLTEFLGWRFPVAAFSSKSFTDEDLEMFLPLVSLQDLSIHASVTDDGLLRLSPLGSLKRLHCIHDQRNKRVVDELDMPTVLDMNEIPLTYALEYLADFHGITFIVDEQKVSGIRREVVITQKVKANTLSLGEALDTALNPHGLGWVVKDGAVTITSVEVADGDRRRALVKKLQAAMPNLLEIEVD